MADNHHRIHWFRRMAAIPATINGLPVTSIADKAFYGNRKLTNMTIPDSVTNIDLSALFLRQLGGRHD